MAEARVIKFCIHVGYIKSQHMEDKSPLKGMWSVSCASFFYFCNDWSDSRQFFMQVEYIKCLAFDNRLLHNGCSQGHMTPFCQILPQSCVWKLVKLGTLYFVCLLIQRSSSAHIIYYLWKGMCDVSRDLLKFCESELLVGWKNYLSRDPRQLLAVGLTWEGHSKNSCWSVCWCIESLFVSF